MRVFSNVKLCGKDKHRREMLDYTHVYMNKTYTYNAQGEIKKKEKKTVNPLLHTHIHVHDV